MTTAAPDHKSHPAYIPHGTALDWGWVGDEAEIILRGLEFTTRDATAGCHGLEVLVAHYRKTAERLGEVAA